VSRRPQAQTLRQRPQTAIDVAIGTIVLGFFRLVRLFDRKRTANVLAWITRHVGPHLHEHRIGRANLVAAFPEKSAAEIDAILTGVWDNLGRVVAEFPHLDRIPFDKPEQPNSGDVSYDKALFRELEKIHKSAKPTIFFAAHLANWEIPALVPPLLGLDSYVLYRRPNIKVISEALLRLRAGCMGTLVPTGFGAPLRLAEAMQAGGYVGMLIDQHHDRGVDVTFFGSKCKANPLLAHLARRFDCEIRGLRVVRLADGNTFWGQMSEPITPVRDASGAIDVAGTTQAVTTVIEQWVREHPEQWLWLHRRWR
jgi:Kdo2-lipid IVA lauroyltransferase/acyltransferase